MVGAVLGALDFCEARVEQGLARSFDSGLFGLDIGLRYIVEDSKELLYSGEIGAEVELIVRAIRRALITIVQLQINCPLLLVAERALLILLVDLANILRN